MNGKRGGEGTVGGRKNKEESRAESGQSRIIRED